MFCQKCGHEVSDEAVVCVNCGCSVGNKQTQSADASSSKAGLGVLFGLLLGFIGLILGIVMFPEGSVARKTFVKAWIITFAVSTAISVLGFILMFAIGLATMPDIMFLLG